MNENLTKVQILIINNDTKETADIKAWLEKDMRVPWSMSHCVNVQEARSRIGKSDLVILKPEMEGVLTPKEVYQSVGDMAFETPILVLTNEKENYGLNTYVMEQGAADTVIRGQFARLVDAIEFSLIRQKITTGTREDAEMAISDHQDKAKADLKDKDDVRAGDKEKSRQTLRMFTGSYAVDDQDKKDK